MLPDHGFPLCNPQDSHWIFAWNNVVVRVVPLILMCVDLTLCHSCLKVHGGVPIVLCIFIESAHWADLIW